MLRSHHALKTEATLSRKGRGDQASQRIMKDGDDQLQSSPPPLGGTNIHTSN